MTSSGFTGGQCMVVKSFRGRRDRPPSVGPIGFSARERSAG
jgi:hypothetical protein